MKLFLEIDDEIDYQKEMYFARLKSKWYIMKVTTERTCFNRDHSANKNAWLYIKVISNRVLLNLQWINFKLMEENSRFHLSNRNLIEALIDYAYENFNT
jgi:hypothetical protein